MQERRIYSETTTHMLDGLLGAGEGDRQLTLERMRVFFRHGYLVGCRSTEGRLPHEFPREHGVARPAV